MVIDSPAGSFYFFIQLLNIYYETSCLKDCRELQRWSFVNSSVPSVSTMLIFQWLISSVLLINCLKWNVLSWNAYLRCTTYKISKIIQTNPVIRLKIWTSQWMFVPHCYNNNEVELKHFDKIKYLLILPTVALIAVFSTCSFPDNFPSSWTSSITYCGLHV